jgi:hypothetical protein
MLDRFKRRFSSTTRRVDSAVTLVNDDTFSISKLSFSSSSRPTTVHVPADEEELAEDAEESMESTEPILPTISQLPVAPRPDNSESRLFSLPTELLLILQIYLEPCTEVSLRQSCSRFLHIYSLPSFYLAGESRFTFLCHLEFDDPNPNRGRTRLVCGHCRDLHPRSAFPSSELKKPPKQRDCRQVWLCPHRALGFDKAVRRIRAVETLFRVETLDPCGKCKPLIRNRSVADRPGVSSYTPAAEVDLTDSSIAGETLLVSKIGILQKPSPSDARGTGSSLNTEIFPTKELAGALSKLDFRICPHIRLGDPYILSKFCRSCLNVRMVRPGERGPPCISFTNGGERTGKCRGACYVKGCKTSFMFQTRESLLPDVTGRRQIWLIVGVYRWLGSLVLDKGTVGDGVCVEDAEKVEEGLRIAKGQESRLWLDHTVDAAEMVEMRGKWKTWLSHYGRKVMPDWSICSLHPDDCNLK